MRILWSSTQIICEDYNFIWEKNDIVSIEIIVNIVKPKGQDKKW
jgi:hypothetical protein